MSIYPSERNAVQYKIEAPLDDQRKLFGAIATVAYDLMNHSITPTEYSLKQGGIITANKTSLKISLEEQGGQLTNGAVALDALKDKRRFNYVKNMDVFTHTSQYGDGERYLTPSDAVYEITSDLTENAVFGALMDTPYANGSEVMHTISRYFDGKAKSRAELFTYRVVTQQLPEQTLGQAATSQSLPQETIAAYDFYPALSEVSLSSRYDNRNALEHQLSVGATYPTSFGDITMRYLYSAEVNSRRLARSKGGGSVIFASPDNMVSRELLTEYAKASEKSNEPVSTLLTGVNMLANALFHR